MTRELSFGRGSARGILRVPLALTVMGLGFALGGCGHTLYVFQANSAASRLEEARELGAEKLAPYEFFYAQQHLEKAQEEAAAADYSDASNFAETAEEYADKAIRLSRDAHRGGGR